MVECIHSFFRITLPLDATIPPVPTYYSQSNGAVEAAVKVAKTLIQKKPTEKEFQRALLSHRTTLNNRFSPAELLLNRKIKCLFPVLQLNKNSTLHCLKKKRKKKEKQTNSLL